MSLDGLEKLTPKTVSKAPPPIEPSSDIDWKKVGGTLGLLLRIIPTLLAIGFIIYKLMN